MNFKIQASPHIRTTNASVDKMMLSVLIALIPVVFMSIVQFKVEFVIALLLSIITVCGVEFIANKIMKKEQTLKDYSALVTAVIFALTIPAGIFSAEIHGTVLKGYLTGGVLIIASGTFAILIGKLFFGGLGRNIFNPAGVGRIFMLVSFGAVLSYFANETQYLSTATPLGIMKSSIEAGDYSSIMSVVDNYSMSDMFIGREAGSFGEVSALAIIISGIFMVTFKVADWRKIVSCLGTFTVLALVYALRLNLPLDFVLVQLFTGSILFGAMFMVTDPVTAPITAPGRVFYAMAIGGLTFVIRVFGAYPEGMLFAILIMNMFTHSIDYHRWLSTKFTRGWIITILVTLAIFIAIVLIGTM
ncbi:MAG: RnfABCDGE type electron transport complex subunit D [Bacilli bacterium]